MLRRPTVRQRNNNELIIAEFLSLMAIMAAGLHQNYLSLPDAKMSCHAGPRIVQAEPQWHFASATEPRA